MATRACELSQWRDPEFIDTLAAAYAETGNFDEAVRYSRAVEKASDQEARKRNCRLTWNCSREVSLSGRRH